MNAHLPIFFAMVLAAMLIAGCDRAPAKTARKNPEGMSTDTYLAKPSDELARRAIPTDVPAAPKPTGALPKDASCVTAECHATYAKARFIHEPIAQRACNACHQDDQGNHHYPLKREGMQTCTFCHTVMNTAAHQHKAVVEKACLACHKPHESETKYLLKAADVKSLCLSCHDVPLKRFSHDPFAKGDCTLCHQPHQSNALHLLRNGDDPMSCFVCHQDVEKAMRADKVVHKPAVEQCATCHSPHASDNPKQLRLTITDTCLKCHEPIKQQLARVNVSHAAMISEKACVNCHNPHGSTEPKLLKERMDQVCMSCHNQEIKAKDGHLIADMRGQLNGKFLHGPVKSGNCSACHEAHGSQQATLLKQAFPKTFYSAFELNNYALCFKCHEQQLVLTKKTEGLTNFRNGEINLHYVHVNRDEKGRSCKSCHAIHGSDLPKHMADAVPYGAANWPMPIGFEQTKDGGKCAPGCHKPREYNRVTPTTMPVVAGGAP